MATRVQRLRAGGTGGSRCEVFCDYFCAFGYRAARMFQNVGRSSGFSLKVTWRCVSLAQVNSKDDGWTAWEAPESEHVSGRMAFRAHEAARRQDAFDPLHMPLPEPQHP